MSAERATLYVRNTTRKHRLAMRRILRSARTLLAAISHRLAAAGGVGLRVTRIFCTIVGIDMAARSVDVANPSGGGVITLDVTDPSRIPLLSSLKVGDTVTAVVSEALAVSIEPAPRRWF